MNDTEMSLMENRFELRQASQILISIAEVCNEAIVEGREHHDAGRYQDALIAIRTIRENVNRIDDVRDRIRSATSKIEAELLDKIRKG